MGFDTLGIEIRDINIECCNFVKKHVRLPNLEFVKDDVLNVSNYGDFDAVFCCGLLYHLDRPRAFLEQLSRRTKKLIIIQTHFSTIADSPKPIFMLSPLTVNESLQGRWYGEFPEDISVADKQNLRWSAFNNNVSFWIRRENLIQLLYELGFQTVFEQFDSFAPNIAEKLDGEYPNFLRGTFIHWNQRFMNNARSGEMLTPGTWRPHDHGGLHIDTFNCAGLYMPVELNLIEPASQA